MKTVCITGSVEAGKCIGWDNFVKNHPNGTIFQSPHYFNLFTDQKKFKPVAVLIEDESGAVVGVLSGIIQYHLPGALKNLTSRCIVMGGPVVQNNDKVLLEIILDAFDNFIKKKAIYTQFRNLFDIQYAATAFSDLNYKYGEHLNILVDISHPEAALWKDVHKQKRYENRRADREGLTFKPISSLDDLEISYKLLSKIYKRIKLPIFPFPVFEKAFTVLLPQGLAAFFGAYLHNELVGTMYTLCYKGRIYDYFAGADNSHYNKFPNSLITWQVMLWGKKNEMTLFDWGGAGKPGVPYGVRDYKEKFGGELVNFGRFEKIHKPLQFQIATSVFKLYQRIK
jgi:lipid II:glycine glycyltransferase (peptidoglycan interpeptide bridge formation enzyme)